MSGYVAKIADTRRLSDAESAAAYLSDLWGRDFKPKSDGTWETIPSLNGWGIESQPIIQTSESLMDEAAYHGWRV